MYTRTHTYTHAHLLAHTHHFSGVNGSHQQVGRLVVGALRPWGGGGGGVEVGG